MTIEQELCDFLLPIIRQSEKNLLAVCGCEVPRAAFLQVYRSYEPIESLPENDKKELKKYVIENFPGESKEWLVDSCRVIYTAGQMI